MDFNFSVQNSSHTLHNFGCRYFVSEKVKGKEHKLGTSDRKFRALPAAVVVLLLCALSFYLGGIFCSGKHKLLEKQVVVVPQTGQTPEKVAVTSPQLKSVVFPECGIDYQDYTPCTDPKVFINFPPCIFLPLNSVIHNVSSLVTIRDTMFVRQSNLGGQDQRVLALFFFFITL